jgi:hypothetical protein
MTYLAATSPDLALGPLQAAACTYRMAFGPRAGQKVRSLQTVPTQAPPPAPVPCVSAQGFEGASRGALRRPSEEETRTVMRYLTRPAIANDKPDTGTYRCQLLRTERLILNRAGQGILTLKTLYRDGTTHRVMSPLEFMQRRVTLVPRPRLHLI